MACDECERRAGAISNCCPKPYVLPNGVDVEDRDDIFCVKLDPNVWVRKDQDG